MQTCIFCKLGSDLEKPHVLFKSEHCFVIKDIAPKAPIHYLIIPKLHIQNVAYFQKEHAAVAADMLLMATTVAHALPNKSDFRLIINNGQAVGQSVFHLHMHLLAGFTTHNDID
ncbi:HIT domain-containing protein [bacterium]|nr:MAG: HIT domain-containing protein [bacterium]QQR62177.1 MAG: HIT domain-containing protein [bacterium]QQR63265.1 MAG: HIT domain-containing protein [bacterium]